MALSGALSLAASGCSVAHSPIFEWAPPSTVDGPQSPTQAGMGGTAGITAGQAAPDAVAGAAGGMQGEPGSDAAIDTDVQFRWTETLPGRGKCAAGVYVGSYTCNTQNGIPGTHVDGTLVLRFVGPSELQQLDVEKGSVNLLVDPTSTVSFDAPVTGKVACTSKSFTGEIPEHMFSGEAFSLGTQLLLLGFCATAPTDSSVKGTLQGKLDADGLSLTGDIVLTIGTCDCKGTYDLRTQR